MFVEGFFGGSTQEVTVQSRWAVEWLAFDAKQCSVAWSVTDTAYQIIEKKSVCVFVHAQPMPVTFGFLEDVSVC